MDLIVEGQGVFLGKHQGRLRVTRDGKILQEAPLIHLTTVIIAGTGVALSSDVVQACAEEGIPLHFLRHDRAAASLYSAGLIGTVQTRRGQLLAFTTPVGGSLARAFVAGKVQNQARLLSYLGRHRRETEPERAAALTLAARDVEDHLAELDRLPAAECTVLRELLLSIEFQYPQRIDSNRKT